jgi:lambda family phage tail tape measure protein
VQGKDMNEVFKNLISTLAQMILKALIFRAIMLGIGGGGFGFEQGGIFGGGGGGGAAPGLSSVPGPHLADGGVVKMAKGALIKQPTIFPFADGIGLAGEKGTEAIMPLMRDSSGRLGVSAEGSGGDVKIINEITIINNADDVDVSQQRRTNANGQEQIVVQIDNALAARVGRGEGQLGKAFQRRFGLSNSPQSK